MHSIVTTFRGAVIKVEVANFCAAMDTLIDQDDVGYADERCSGIANGRVLTMELYAHTNQKLTLTVPVATIDALQHFETV